MKVSYSKKKVSLNEEKNVNFNIKFTAKNSNYCILYSTH